VGGTPACGCAEGFTGLACETAVNAPSLGSSSTMAVSGLAVGSWKHFKVTITGAASSDQTMKLPE
jgi:hypothetical protein